MSCSHSAVPAASVVTACAASTTGWCTPASYSAGTYQPHQTRMKRAVTATGQLRSLGGTGAAAIVARGRQVRPRPRHSTSQGAPSTSSGGAYTPSTMSCSTRTQMNVPAQ